MQWIISSDPQVFIDASNMSARLQYIQSVTGSEVTDWAAARKSSILPKTFFYCISKDGLNGTFITAHIGEVLQICSLQEIATGDFVIANTCIWEKSLNKKILYHMMKTNRNIDLWFSKQSLSVEENYRLRQSTMLSKLGEFGFGTSLSERVLFSNRRKGFMKAVTLAFNKVSPVILPEDYGGIV